jgi:hypothetical protein
MPRLPAASLDRAEEMLIGIRANHLWEYLPEDATDQSVRRQLPHFTGAQIYIDNTPLLIDGTESISDRSKDFLGDANNPNSFVAATPFSDESYFINIAPCCSAFPTEAPSVSRMAHSLLYSLTATSTHSVSGFPSYRGGTLDEADGAIADGVDDKGIAVYRRERAASLGCGIALSYSQKLVTA